MDKRELLASIKKTPHILGRLLGFNELLPLHTKWIKDCWDDKTAKGLMAFRGSYKTSSVLITGIIRYLLFNPNARIIIVRKTHTEACRVVRAISTAFEREEITSIFFIAHEVMPKKIIDANDKLLFNFKQRATVEPSILAFGIDSSMTGAHADVIIADDIIGEKDRASRAERESVKYKIRELAANILDPGAKIIFLGTKWAAGDGWDVIAEFTDIDKYPVSKYNFLPTEAIEEKRRRLSPFLYAINYELELIADESLLFQDPVYGVFDVEIWRKRRVYAHIDAAFGGADYCALTIMSGDNAIGWLYNGHVQEWTDFITRQYNRYHCTEILLETNADKGYLARDLRAKGLKTNTYAEAMNKEIKISTYLYKKWNGLIWDNDTDPEYMNQILDWKQGSNGHDDAADSAASLIRGMEDAKPMTAETKAALFW
jgi:hypothetical protein